MNSQNIISIIIKAFLIWLILSILGFFFRINIITLFIPFYEKISEMSYKNYHIEISIKQEKTDKVVISATPLKILSSLQNRLYQLEPQSKDL